MISIYKTLRSFNCRPCKTTQINTLNELLLNKCVRQCATKEVALEKVKVTGFRKSQKKVRYDYSSWLLLVIPVSTFGLGTWQVFRKFEKDEINEKLSEKIKGPPIDFPENLEEINSMEFEKVRVRGKFDHSKELYLGPRAKIDENSCNKHTYLFSESKPGYLVITPFTLSDRNLTILVNRGWVPVKQMSPEARPEGQVTEEVEIVGFIRKQNVKKPLGVNNFPEKNRWVYRDLNQMSEVTGASPIIIDAVLTSSFPGGPLGGQTITHFENNHLSYIITWYGVAIMSAYLWYLRHLKKLPVIV